MGKEEDVEPSQISRGIRYQGWGNLAKVGFLVKLDKAERSIVP